MFLTQEDLQLSKKDKERFKHFKKEHVFLDAWSEFAFHDMHLDNKERSESGSFYTPEWIVRVMVKRALDSMEKPLDSIRILEPSCGSGNFLEIIVQEMMLRTGKSAKTLLETQIFGYDNSVKAVKKAKIRLFNVFGVEAKNIIHTDSLKEQTQFDLIIGNPPYGNLLSEEYKKNINDKYNNIALNFLDHCFEQLLDKGIVYFIVPHSFSRAGAGAKTWRKKVYENHALFEVIDVGNPFFDITLEQVIIGLKKSKNTTIQTHSIRRNETGYLVPYEKFYHINDYRWILYYDAHYESIMAQNPDFPFHGKRGKDVDKKILQTTKQENNYWIILGKNITKDGLKHITNYDRYTTDRTFLLNKEVVAITQFGTNLKATLLPRNVVPSGGVVIISHENLTQEETINYLNCQETNDFLIKYVLNCAELTVHLDGKYLKEIPYLKKSKNNR